MMAAREPDSIVWRTSSYSGGSGNCVQVAPTPGRVLVRNSQDPGGPALDIPAPPGAPSSPLSPADPAALRRLRTPTPNGALVQCAEMMPHLLRWHLL